MNNSHIFYYIDTREVLIMKRILSILLSAIFVISLFTGCGATETSSDASGNQSDAIKLNKPESVAETFIKSLVSADYDTALSCLNIDEECSFLTANDIEFAVPRSSFADVVNVNMNDFTFSTGLKGSYSDAASCVVSAVDNNDSNNTRMFSVPMVLDDNNKWAVDNNEFYYENYSFCTAGGNVNITVNGKKVSDKFCVNNSAGATGLAKEYTLPYVGKKEIEVVVSADGNYVYTQSLATSANNEIGDDDKVFKALDETEETECLDFIKNTWNDINSLYESGKHKATDVLDYLSVNADSDIANQIWDGLELLHKPNSIEKDRDDNFNLKLCKKSSGTDMLWLTDNKILVNFDYELTWDYLLADWNQSTKRQSEIILAKEDGKYKIDTLLDNGLFTENNSFTKEW